MKIIHVVLVVMLLAFSVSCGCAGIGIDKNTFSGMKMNIPITKGPSAYIDKTVVTPVTTSTTNVTATPTRTGPRIVYV